MGEVSAEAWEQLIAGHPEAHLLQTRAWGEAKAGFGWQPGWVIEGESGAQVLFRRLPLGLSVGYLPKGPVGPRPEGLWPALDQLCRSRRSIFLRIEPDAWEPDDPGTMVQGLRPAKAIQPRRTVIVSLQGSEDDLLARMKQKTRYNVRLAEKKDVQVRESADLDGFYGLMQQTSQRDGFAVHSQAYYRRVYELFAPLGQCALLSATFEGRLLAGLMVFAHGSRAWYLYGASSDEERNRMPAYLLQWEAIRWARSKGCASYDLYGVPDVDEDRLESEFAGRSDGLWGVYRFKRGFGGEVLRSVGAWDRVYQPLLYRAYDLYAARRGGEAD
jgi:lipid II:glycine glycyltransferase (peptidoglycan interpeptide bridge formation enzyme)